MITCQEFIAQVAAFIDGELDADWYQRIVAHSHICPKCVVVLDTMRQTVRIAGSEEIFDLPAGVSSRLHAAVERAAAAAPQAARPAPARRASWRGPGWLLAAALVLIALGGLQWWQQARIHSWQGWLIDAHCAVKYVAAGRLPMKHPRWCALEPVCQASGYGLYTLAGRFERFDASGSRAALVMLRASNQPDDLRVTVHGRERNGVIHVTRFTLDQANAHTIAVHNEMPRDAEPANQGLGARN